MLASKTTLSDPTEILLWPTLKKINGSSNSHGNTWLQSITYPYTQSYETKLTTESHYRRKEQARIDPLGIKHFLPAKIGDPSLFPKTNPLISGTYRIRSISLENDFLDLDILFLEHFVWKSRLAWWLDPSRPSHIWSNGRCIDQLSTNWGNIIFLSLHGIKTECQNSIILFGNMLQPMALIRMTHFFQLCRKSSLASYADVNLSLDPISLGLLLLKIMEYPIF